ncbi:MAG: hypothetical protein Q7T36_12420 [Fluviicoccus sp.]|uniref:hypothetical protein n=1 Tax=Fluviicoccus sp. TaxID=2003552 RepID=UPI002727BD07|nr:hypothetical protein [Fluviicoccus sp.]MDO8331265.1 hypothetical protein [Fluviicoccus sp.]
MMRGAGGTQGGAGEFLLGLVMMCGGFYMLLSAIVVSSGFGMGYGLYRFSGWGGGMFTITTGMIMIPFMIGVGLVFYQGKSILGWCMAIGSLAAMIMGVISSIHFSFRSMNAFELIVILVLSIGGLGLFLRSLRAGG